MGVDLSGLGVGLFKVLLGKGSGPIVFKSSKRVPYLVSEGLCLLNEVHVDQVLDQKLAVTYISTYLRTISGRRDCSSERWASRYSYSMGEPSLTLRVKIERALSFFFRIPVVVESVHPLLAARLLTDTSLYMS